LKCPYSNLTGLVRKSKKINKTARAQGLKNQINVVSFDWLEDSLVARRCLPVHKFLWKTIVQTRKKEIAKANQAKSAQVVNAKRTHDEEAEMIARKTVYLDSQANDASRYARCL
jgi:hypothetical protein